MLREGHNQATDDSDIVAEVVNAAGYQPLEARLRGKYFVLDIRNYALICRWRYQNIAVNRMPTDSKVYRFTNRWYPIVTQTVTNVVVDGTSNIRLISALATDLASDAASQYHLA